MSHFDYIYFSSKQKLYKRSGGSKNRFPTTTQSLHEAVHISFGFEWVDVDEHISYYFKVKMKTNKKRGNLLFHHCFFFGRLVVRELQEEDPLHQHLGVAVKVQRALVVDD